jgi:CBS domain-containing protein
MRIKDVMTHEVVTVQPGASLHEAARLLVEKRISGLPVVDSAGRLLGVLSEADVLVRDGARSGGGPLEWLLDPADIADRLRLAAHVVGEAMTLPAITIEASRPAAAAAELMIEHRINRLPVVEGGTLVGIVTRGDLVRALVRSDEEIALEVREDVVARTMWADKQAV